VIPEKGGHNRAGRIPDPSPAGLLAAILPCARGMAASSTPARCL
jgi:hypothetical protein